MSRNNKNLKHKKILIVSPYYFPYTSGMTMYVQKLSEGLAKKGYEVDVITSKHEKLRRNETIKKVKVNRIPVLFKFRRGCFTPTLLLEMIRYLRKYDVVNIHTPILEVGLISLITKLFGKKVIVTYHCDLKMHGLLSKIIERIYYSSVWLAGNLSDKIVVNSLDYGRKSRIKKFRKKFIEIHSPIYTEKFRKTTRKRFREKYKISKNEKIVGFVGRLVEEKGLEYLVKAIPLVNEKYPNCKFVIVGEGKEIAGGLKESVKSKLLKIIKELNIKNVIFTGYLKEKMLIDFYSACDVFVLPSIDRLESFGIVQIEALLCGAPVVSTDLPGVKDVIKLTGGGITVPQRNEKELAEAIIKILKNRKKYVVPRKKLLKYFGIDKTVEEYSKLFMKYENY